MKAILIFSGKSRNVKKALSKMREIYQAIPGITIIDIIQVLKYSQELEKDFRKILSGIDLQKLTKKKNQRS